MLPINLKVGDQYYTDKIQLHLNVQNESYPKWSKDYTTDKK
jgi:hypothetical protein